MKWDTSELDGLVKDLGKVPGKAVPVLTGVMKQSSGRVRDQLRADAQGIGHAPHFPKSITDEMKPGLGVIGAEVGPDKDLRQGALGNILYFGTAKNAAVLDINGPLDREEPKLSKAAADALLELLQ